MMTECHLFYQLSYNDSNLGLFKYCLYVEIIPANMGLDRCTILLKYFMHKGATTLRHNTVIVGS